MNSKFKINPLNKDVFSRFWRMSTPELNAIGAYLFNADECPCYPCRVSLTDAQVGERVLALSYEHHPQNSPYRATGPIFIRANAQTATLTDNEVPDMLKHRLLSLRGYNDKHLMIEAETMMGTDLEVGIAKQFSNSSVSYIHLHNAAPGCFNCSVTRS